MHLSTPFAIVTFVSTLTCCSAFIANGLSPSVASCLVGWTIRRDVHTHCTRLLPSTHKCRKYSFSMCANTPENIPFKEESSASGNKGFGGRKTIPRPKIITPSRGSVNPNLDKFLMMYTCKCCSNRNAQMVSKVAYYEGTVISRCKQCQVKHLIADNKGLLDLPEYGKRISEYLEKQGETVQQMSISEQQLEDNYLVDDDGVMRLVAKIGGQLSPDSTVVEYPTRNKEDS